MTGRFLIALLVASIMALLSASLVREARAGSGETDKQVTLTGRMLCAKCSLGEGSQCQSVLQVKEGDKTTNYYLADNTLSKDSHAAVCRAPKDNVSVTGTVSERDGKEWITADKITGLPGKG